METSVVLIAIIVAVILYFVIKTNRSESPPRGTGAPTSEPRQNLKTYRIFTLGTSGAGKTCFMASMFNRLSLYKPDIGFYLDVPDNRQRILLTNIYSEMTDPYSLWPAGTVNEVEWRFNCVVSANGNNYPVFQFTYLDYAGGHLTESSQADLLDAQAKVSEADAVLAILDGQKILRRLENKESLIEDPKRRIGAELNFVLPYLMKSPKKPIHFVISKWDLLEGKYLIKDVRDCLLQYDSFRTMIDYRRQLRIPTRLIPVSAVGNGFATVSNDGRMEKTPGVNPQPFQVEMSIASTLIDAFETATKELSGSQFDQLRRFSSNQHKAAGRIISALRDGTHVLSYVLRDIVPFPLGLAPVAAMRLLEVVHDKFGKSYLELERDQKITLGMVKDQETAINSVITSYHFLARELERKFPDSALC